MAAVDFLHHENPPTRDEVEPQPKVQEASDKPTRPCSRDTGSIADRKRSDKAPIVKTKVADVETTLQRSPMKRPLST
ncbi:hypothetical protein TNCV_4895541 [Trichonephila clavipes]|nr:hypothetical protein TNCV_4895541 [Trichonephila clavipes]